MQDTWKTLAIQAALKAGEAIMEVYTHKFNVQYKQDHSPLTQADLAAHAATSEYLKKTQLPILSEEGSIVSYKQRREWDSFWMVDPLDGTKEFIQRNGEFTVNIAFIRNNKPIFGIIYAPAVKELFVGDLSTRNSYKWSNPINVSRYSDFLELAIVLSRKRTAITSDKMIKVATSRSHLNSATEEFVNKLKQGAVTVIIVPSGSALKFCRLAEGAADIYPRFAPCMEWDTAAADVICEGVGVYIYKEGSTKRLDYNKKSLLNPNFVAH